MSDYVYKKAVRLPIPAQLYNSNYENINDYPNANEKCSLGYIGELQCFEVNSTDEGYYYIDYVIESRYGEYCGDYGFAFELNREERYKYAAEFDKLNIEYNKNDLVGIIQCYYNGYEPPDIYEIKGFDEL